METLQKHHENLTTQSLLPSPNSHSSTSSSCSTSANGFHGNSLPPPPPSPHHHQHLLSPKPITRSESTNPYPTTFVQADTNTFKQVVQMLTGSPKPTNNAASSAATAAEQSVKSHSHNIPPVKSMPKKNQSSGFKLYERRNSLKNLKINPLNPIFAPPSSGFSPRKHEILSPSILDFPALVLSPVTPLIPDPFDRSGGAVNYAHHCYSPLNNCSSTGSGGNNIIISSRKNNNCDLMDTDAEEKAIKEKGFFLHPSPASTPREAEPRLLPLFPVTSPRVSGSANPSSSLN